MRDEERSYFAELCSLLDPVVKVCVSLALKLCALLDDNVHDLMISRLAKSSLPNRHKVGIEVEMRLSKSKFFIFT